MGRAFAAHWASSCCHNAVNALVALSGLVNVGTPSLFNNRVMSGASGLTYAMTGLSVPGNESRIAPAIRSDIASPDEPTMIATAS